METKKERNINIQYEAKDARKIRLMAALMDVSAKDLMYNATMSYMTTLATETNDELLKSIIKGEVTETV